MAKKNTTTRSKTTPAAPPPETVTAAPAPKPRARKTAKPQADSVVAPESPVVAAAVSGQQEPSEEDIRIRAYHRYLERGGGHGMDFEDWLEAKRDLQNIK